MKTFRKGGIHPAANKLTGGAAIRELPTPAEVRLMLAQAIGAPAKSLVKAGDRVAAGQMVAEAGGFVSAPVHTPVAGTVKRIEKIRNIRGLWQEAIIIATDPETPQAIEGHHLSEAELEALTPEEIIAKIGDAGVVGLGGAAFPTRVKLSVPDGKHADFILINGAECEPYLTCDDVLMRTSAARILGGARLLMRASGASRCLVGIEENKPEAIKKMRSETSNFPDVEIIVLKKKYPQGGEKQLIKALTGREVPLGGLPIDCGCIVDNVATAAAVWDAVAEGKPLTHRIVTVTGPTLANPGNFLAPVGVDFDALIDFAGGLPEGTGKVISGGPMMGQAAAMTDAPTVKANGGITVLPAQPDMHSDYGPCLRCARCVSACPMGLEPYLFMLLAQHDDWETARQHTATGCMECGCCSYVCPSHRPLLDFIKLSKSRIKQMKK